MFEHLSYLGYTLLFCGPPLLLLWLRADFAAEMRKDLLRIIWATVFLTMYGCIAWPIAIRFGAWTYASDKITNVKLFNVLFLEDAVWWFLVSLLFASFVSLSMRHEDRGEDVVVWEALGLLRSFKNAFSGLRMIRLERNTTIHIAAATFVLMEAFFFRIKALEWLLVILAIALVLGLELLNSALERIGTRLSKEADPEIRLLKDAAAAGVLVASLGAAAMGAVIFLPRLLSLLR